jgi:2-amino-4-hydroxy-6-hydroxymethyldihydropteridine diphosphokinase
MHRAYLSLGSNIDREANIRSALFALEKVFGALAVSPVYESEAVGFSGAAFFNLIVAVETNLSIEQLVGQLKQIEDHHGRDRSGAKFSSRSLDIDLVTYDEKTGTFSGVELPRPELFYNAFVLLPMADLLGKSVEPKTGQTYSSLAATLDHKQKLWQVDFALPEGLKRVKTLVVQ